MVNVLYNFYQVRVEGRFSPNQGDALQFPFPYARIDFITDLIETFYEAVIDVVTAAAFDITTQIGLYSQVRTIFIGVFQQ